VKLTTKAFNNYQNRYHHRHVDLMDVMAMFNGRHFQNLMMLRIFRFPGKRGETGYHVPEYVRTEQWLKLTSYCEGDVLNTWLIYLRWLLLKGQLNQHDHRIGFKPRSIIYKLKRNKQNSYRYGNKHRNILYLPQIFAPKN
jgi:predicted PolB exonuclease-like 3'-5' exonuclease